MASLPQVLARMVRSLWRRGAAARCPIRRRRIVGLEPLEARLALTGYIVDLPLTLTKPDGSPLTSLQAGDDFVLHAWAQDVRDDPHGVFSAYMDVTWDANLAVATGPIQWTSSYAGGHNGSVSPGLLDEAGAFAGTGELGGLVKEVFSVPMRASAAGTLSFAADPADSQPVHAVLEYNPGADPNGSAPIANELVHFGTASINVGGGPAPIVGPVAADDTLHAVAGRSTALDVLSNDRAGTSGSFSITSIGSPSHGAASASGENILYRPAAGFTGPDSFTYTISDDSGRNSSAVVHVTVDPPDSGVGPRVDLELTLTRPDGSPLTTLNPGEDFVLHAWAQDVRNNPHGVFAAYMDVTWDSNLAMATGAVQWGSNYGNGQPAGSVSFPGLLDEAGGFSSPAELGGGAKEVFSMPMRASGAGKLSFAADPADQQPLHAVLEYNAGSDLSGSAPVPNDQIHFGMATIDVGESSVPGGGPVAVDDFLHAAAETGTVLDVLSNDQAGTSGSFSITSIGTPGHGTVLPNGGGSLIYRPAAGFVGSDSFAYTISDNSGHSSSAVVHVTVDPPDSGVAPHVDFDLQLTKPDGSPLSSLAPGDDFVLHVFTQDKTPFARGVYAAYLDVTWDSGLAVVTGPLQYGSSYPNGQSGNASAPGLLDEAGAFSSKWLDGSLYEVFSVPMRATAAGDLVFLSDPADNRPANDVLVSGIEDGHVLDSQISFGSASIHVGATMPPPTPEPDTLNVPNDGTPISLNVLANDGPGATRIVDVTQPAAGNVAIAPDGRYLLYSAVAGYSGAITFSYGVMNSSGETDTADVTLNVGDAADPGVALDGGVLQITGSEEHDRVQVSLSRRMIVVSGTIGQTHLRQSFKVSDVQRIEAALGGGDDSLSIAGNVRAAVLADGGDGNDTIIAGGGSAVLLGGSGNDRLNGGGRRDVIVGGAGGDQVSGGGDSDILIGGTTAYDGDRAALLAIQAQWNARARRASRIASLRDGTGSFVQPLGVSLAEGATVLDDGEVDKVFGQRNVDWLFEEGGSIQSLLSLGKTKRSGW